MSELSTMTYPESPSAAVTTRLLAAQEYRVGYCSANQAGIVVRRPFLAAARSEVFTAAAVGRVPFGALILGGTNESVCDPVVRIRR
jgi:hypothetical protein